MSCARRRWSFNAGAVDAAGNLKQDIRERLRTVSQFYRPSVRQTPTSARHRGLQQATDQLSRTANDHDRHRRRQNA